jgi:HAD superfamily hydrolase (TIGR01509 family)
MRRSPKPTIIRALVFDFNGLILDAGSAELRAWQEIFRTHDTELPVEWWRAWQDDERRSGDPCEQLEHQLGELVDRERIHARRRSRSAEILAAHSTLPGVNDFIDRAQEIGLRLGVTSSSPRHRFEAQLAQLELGACFDALRCEHEVKRAKPDPALHLDLCRALDVQPCQTIAVEDSPAGIQGAKSAGLFCVSVPNSATGSLSLDGADLALVSLSSATLDEVIDRATATP